MPLTAAATFMSTSSHTSSIYFDAPTSPHASIDMNSQAPENTKTYSQYGDRHVHTDTPVRNGFHPATHPDVAHAHGQSDGPKRTVDSSTRDEARDGGLDNVNHPTPEHGPTNQQRSATAESALTNNDKSRIAKTEGKDGKRVIKVLKDEARAEDKLLKSKIKELENHMKVHKQAAKEEASAASLHSKAVKAEHKRNMNFLAARSKHESALADLKAKEAALASTKGHAQQQSESLKEREKEVAEMRERKALDDREREAKLKQLANPTSASAS